MGKMRLWTLTSFGARSGLPSAPSALVLRTNIPPPSGRIFTAAC